MTTTNFRNTDCLPGVAYVGMRNDRIYVSEMLNISQARDLRDWLSKALPAEECPVCRQFLEDDEIIGSCATGKDGLHRRTFHTPATQANGSGGEA